MISIGSTQPVVQLDTKPVVTVFVTCESSSSERRFNRDITIGALKERLEPITGIPIATMQIKLFDKNDQFVCTLNDNDKKLGFYSVMDYGRLQVDDLNPYRIKNEWTDVSQVKKFEISEEEYNKRNDSVRHFLQKNKLGQYSEESQRHFEKENDPEGYFEEAQQIKVGDRCEVNAESKTGMPKRGTVKYVGKTEFKPGYWIGIAYDEPQGKHNGTVQGKSYFTCLPKYGVFVRPNKVTVGDFPEEDFDLDDDDLDEL
jgi:tubulin-folding cofactor B